MKHLMHACLLEFKSFPLFYHELLVGYLDCFGLQNFILSAYLNYRLAMTNTPDH